MANQRMNLEISDEDEDDDFEEEKTNFGSH
jgi:hypothetical protein